MFHIIDILIQFNDDMLFGAKSVAYRKTYENRSHGRRNGVYTGLGRISEIQWKVTLRGRERIHHHQHC